jgi:hypothetical protein
MSRTGEGAVDGIWRLWLMCPKRGQGILGFVGVCDGDEYVELEIFHVHLCTVRYTRVSTL